MVRACTKEALATSINAAFFLIILYENSLIFVDFYSINIIFKFSLTAFKFILSFCTNDIGIYLL